MGTLTIAFEGETLGEVPIVAGQDAPLDELLYYTSQITGFFNSPVIKAITVVCLLHRRAVYLLCGVLQSQAKEV